MCSEYTGRGMPREQLATWLAMTEGNGKQHTHSDLASHLSLVATADEKMSRMQLRIEKHLPFLRRWMRSKVPACLLVCSSACPPACHNP